MNPASGTFLLRVAPELHARLREAAAKRKISLNRFCADILERAIGRKAGREREIAGATPLGRLTARCRDVFDDELLGVVLFGSTARGEDTATSDVDLLLPMAPGCPIRRDLYARWDRDVEPVARHEFDREVNPHFCHAPESPDSIGGLWLEVAIDGKVLWERGQAVSRPLRAVRQHLASGRAVRRVQDGHPYWVTSP